MFSVVFKVDKEEAEKMSIPVSDDLIDDFVAGEGRNIEEAFASIRAQIEMYHPELPWRLISVKYYKSDQR